MVVPGGRGHIRCRTLWAGRRSGDDAALLLADEDLVTATAAEAFRTSLFARVDGPTPLLNCYALGFPQVSRYDGQKLDTEQFVGTIKPGSGRMRDEYVVEGGGTPPAAREDGESPWAGMSGAPLFSGRHLIGVVTKDLSGWQHSRLTALPLERLPELPDFVGICTSYLGSPLRLATLRQTPDHSASFEDRYRAYVTETFGELSIFGLDFSRSEHAQWPLDSAYLSLELIHGEGGEGATPERGRVESALRDRQRVLLRGAAGSGKTTLVQWLAVNAARDSFPDQLTHLAGRIPVVLPLRTLVRGAALPAPGDFLSAAGHPLSPPAGWMEAVLTEGRGLLLVDGVDEMPEADRARTKEWLVKLLAAYPRTAVVVTTRPTAVDDKWLSRKEFTEFQLLPMNRRDVTAFVHRWHTAARSITRRDSERSELDAYEQQLLSTLPRKQDLARLATNPLMCAMICALHRDRRGFLPDSRMKLYGAALTMLLVRRDRERAIGAPEGLTVAEEEQQKILQEIAYWMIRNEIAEAEQDDVIGLIARLLPAMPQVAPPEDASRVFRFLLHRSGVLRAPSVGTVDFIHRTFLDFLGARAAIEAQDINLIASRAHDPQWEDVVRMAVGHARDSERAALLTKLVELGDAISAKSHNIKARIHLLAAASLEHATSLDPMIRTEVERRASALIPPKNEEEANRLADAGPLVLGLLPGPEGLSDMEAAAVVRTAQLVGGDHALQVLREYAAHPARGVQVELIYSWASFESMAFAELILAHIDTADLAVAVHSEEQLAALHLAKTVPCVTFTGDLSSEGMANAVRAVGARTVSIFDNNRLKNLEAFTEMASLIELGVFSCSQVNDYSGLSKLRLESLRVQSSQSSTALSGLAAAANLPSLTLSVTGDDGEPDMLDLPAHLPTLPSVTRLELVLHAVGDLDAKKIRTRFPNLRRLHLQVVSGEPVTVDLSALTWVPEITTLVLGASVHLKGTELLSIRCVSPHEEARS